MAKFIAGVKARAVAFVKNVWATEPTRVVGVLVSVTLTIAAAFSVALDQGTVTEIVTLILSLLVPPAAAEGLRRKVKPVS